MERVFVVRENEVRITLKANYLHGTAQWLFFLLPFLLFFLLLLLLFQDLKEFIRGYGLSFQSSCSSRPFQVAPSEFAAHQ